MEPATNVRTKKAALWGGILLGLVALGACRPAADSPPPTPEREQPLATEQVAEQPGPETTDGDAPSQATAAGRENEQHGPPPPPESSEDTQPADAGPDDHQRLGELSALENQRGPRPAPREALDKALETEAQRPTRAAEGPQWDPFTEEKPQPDPLPSPLVDDLDNLEPLQANQPIWIAKDRSCVVIVGRVCQRRAPLELFACLRGSKEHEAVVAVDVPAFVVYAGLTAAYAEPGTPVQFVPEFAPPTGTEIEVTVRWEDDSGRRRQAPAQDWIRDVAGLFDTFEGIAANPFDEELNIQDRPDAFRDMQQPWVFAGSRFLVDEETGQRSYLADVEGDLICVANFPSAVLDVPIRSSDSNAALLFEAFTERIPPIGTPVTLILTPKIEKKAD